MPLLLLWWLWAAVNCSGTAALPAIVYVGSTPCDEPLREVFAIADSVGVDFIRWQLTLKTGQGEPDTFALRVVYGESQPNTLGFKGGGTERSYEGSYTISQSEHPVKGEIVQLKSSQLPGELSLVRLNDNLLHLLTPARRLMIGNGGWSYTLNRETPDREASDRLPVLTDAAWLTADTALQVVFEGRTPCQELLADHPGIEASPSCFKKKWAITLYRDAVTRKPTTYSLRKIVDNAPRNITGKWVLLKGIPSHPEAVIYQLDPDQPDKTISLLAGDRNVLFFLNKAQALYVGNRDFSFTLNRKEE